MYPPHKINITMRIIIIALLSCIASSLYAQFELPKELIEPAPDSNYLLISGENGVLDYTHKDSLGFSQNLTSDININVCNDTCEYKSLSSAFAFASQYSTVHDSLNGRKTVTISIKRNSDNTPTVINEVLKVRSKNYSNIILTSAGDSVIWECNNQTGHRMIVEYSTIFEMNNLNIIGRNSSNTDFLLFRRGIGGFAINTKSSNFKTAYTLAFEGSLVTVNLDAFKCKTGFSLDQSSVYMLSSTIDSCETGIVLNGNSNPFFASSETPRYINHGLMLSESSGYIVIGNSDFSRNGTPDSTDIYFDTNAISFVSYENPPSAGVGTNITPNKITDRGCIIINGEPVPDFATTDQVSDTIRTILNINTPPGDTLFAAFDPSTGNFTYLNLVASDTLFSASPLTGDGTVGDPISIDQNGATTGQALVWDGAGWTPGSVLSESYVQQQISDSIANLDLLTIPIDSAYYVSKSGNDTTAIPGNRGKPWRHGELAIQQAKTNKNKTIFLPGNYTFEDNPNADIVWSAGKVINTSGYNNIQINGGLTGIDDTDDSNEFRMFDFTSDSSGVLNLKADFLSIEGTLGTSRMVITENSTTTLNINVDSIYMLGPDLTYTAMIGSALNTYINSRVIKAGVRDIFPIILGDPNEQKTLQYNIGELTILDGGGISGISKQVFNFDGRSSIGNVTGNIDFYSKIDRLNTDSLDNGVLNKGIFCVFPASGTRQIIDSKIKFDIGNWSSRNAGSQQQFSLSGGGVADQTFAGEFSLSTGNLRNLDTDVNIGNIASNAVALFYASDGGDIDSTTFNFNIGKGEFKNGPIVYMTGVNIANNTVFKVHCDECIHRDSSIVYYSKNYTQDATSRVEFSGNYLVTKTGLPCIYSAEDLYLNNCKLENDGVSNIIDSPVPITVYVSGAWNVSGSPVGANVTIVRITEFGNADTWLKPQMEDGNNVEVNAPGQVLTLNIEGLAMSNTNTVPAQASQVIAHGTSNSVSGSQNAVISSDASFTSYDPTFTFPSTLADKNAIVSSTGGYVLRDALTTRYNAILGVTSSDVTDGTHNVLISTRYGRHRNVDYTVGLLGSTNAYVDNAVHHGADTDDLSGTVFTNVGAGQTTTLVRLNEHTVNNGNDTFLVASIPLDTINKLYTVTLTGQLVVNTAGSGGYVVAGGVGEQTVDIFSCDGSTVTPGVFASTVNWQQFKDGSFSGPVNGRFFFLNFTGANMEIWCDAGDQPISGTPSVIRSFIKIEMLETKVD
jgi:hypothetical protein